MASSSSSSPRRPKNPTPNLDAAAAKLLLQAAFEGNIPLLKKLARRVDGEGKGVAATVAAARDDGSNGAGPLHVAVARGRVEMCKFLVKELGVNADATDNTGETPLIFASYSGSTAIVRTLLDRGANPNKADNNGFTPLHSATILGRCEIAQLLLSNGAYVDPVFACGTPLHLAATDGNESIMKVLLQHKADPNKVVRCFYTPLILALFVPSLKCVKLLVKAGADVNGVRPVTPLIVAANEGLIDCIKCLLEAGTDANIPDEFGRMPIEIAASQGRRECVEILFPFTSPVARVADWSIDGIIQYAKLGSPEPQGHLLYEKAGSDPKVLGDDAFSKREYANASMLYTTAIQSNPDDPTLYVKRTLCWLRMGEKDKALLDASTYKNMQPDFSRSCYEQGAALMLLKEHDKACAALFAGLKLDFGNDQIGKASRKPLFISFIIAIDFSSMLKQSAVPTHTVISSF